MSRNRIGLRGQDTDLEQLLRDVFDARHSGRIAELHRLLSTPLVGAKSGLHAIRDGYTDLAKRVADEHAASRREAGWAPLAEIQGRLVEEHGGDWQEQRAKSRPGLARYVWPSGVAVVVALEGDEARVVGGSSAQASEGEVRGAALVVLSMAKRLGPECPPGVTEDLARMGKAGDLAAIKGLRDQLQERLECLGSNSEAVSS